MLKKRPNCPSPLPSVPQAVRNVPHARVGIVVVVVVAIKVEVVVPGKQMPLPLGFCCLQNFTRLRQARRCSACIVWHALLSAFVPTQTAFVGTRARQCSMSCLQSLRQ